MKTFQEWLQSESEIFSATQENKSAIIYSKEKGKFFWIVHARNWEDIHRTANWYSIVLMDTDEAINLLNGTTRIRFNTSNKDIMKKVKRAKPDMLNSDPHTRSYQSFEAAIQDLCSC